MTSTPATFDFDELRFNGSATAFLFEGRKRAGIDVSMFIVRTPPGGSVELHTHPYSETFVLVGHPRADVSGHRARVSGPRFLPVS